MVATAQFSTVLHEVHSGLQSIFGNELEQLLLYGSYARGEQDSESDIDLLALVNMPKERLAGYRRAVNHPYLLQENRRRSLDNWRRRCGKKRISRNN